MPTHEVVFNADDLGRSQGVNEAVQAAAEAGLVREMSLMVTLPSAGEGARVARALVGQAGVGLHFTLTEGRALAGTVQNITDRGGWFRPRSEVLLRSILGQVDPADVERELRAQLARMSELGLEPTHINGHEHVHAFPNIRSVVLEVAEELGPLHVRTPGCARAWSSPRAAVIASLGRGFAREMRRPSRPLHTLPLVGASLYTTRHDRYRDAVLRTARTLKAPRVEWVVHPRSVAGDSAETDVLTDPAVLEQLRAMGIEPKRYAD